MITQDLGIATAYGYAKSKGYTGTEAEFAELMASYASTAQTAIEAADRAVEANTAAQSAKTSAQSSASTASTAAQTATSKASEAVTAAGTATTKASEAGTSAGTASTAAQTATNKASEATTAATTATTKASEASESATTATAAKTDAETARDAAAQSASRAEQSAESIDPDEFNRKIYAAFATDMATGAVASFADGADSIPMKDVLVHIEPVQAGSGDPSPDNVRPITGWTGAHVTRCGKNLLNLVESEMTLSGWNRTFPIAVKAGTYILSCENKFGKDGSEGALVKLLDDNDATVVTLTTGYEFGNSTFIGKVATITEEVASKIKKVQFSLRAGGTIYNDIVQGNLQLELGSTATDYEPCHADTYNITFLSEAGTVYGGTLDVTKGELVVDRAQIASYNGEALPSTWISDRDVYVSGTTPTIGAQVVYKLASPITYTLTPQEITSLLGTNNLWADCGDTEVEYRADTALYIGRLTEPDADMIADSNITSGQYFMVGNSLYRATSNIASGASVIVGTNAVKVSLATALNEINQ